LELEFASKRGNEGKGHFRKDWDHFLTYREIEASFHIYGEGSLVVIPLLGHTPGHQGRSVRLKKDGEEIEKLFPVRGDKR